MRIIGISGTNGAGKDSIGQYLADKHNWLFVSVTDILRHELRLRKLSIERENLRNLSAQWRKQYGLGVLIDKAVEIYKSKSEKYEGLAIASLRNPGEADEVHKLGGKVIWVDADPRVRYKRISGRQRGTEDQKTYEEFLKEELHEMQHKGHRTTLSLEGVKAKSDIFITNNSNSINEFYADLEKLVSSVR
jgi:dephospho-CoA kinase